MNAARLSVTVKGLVSSRIRRLGMEFSWIMIGNVAVVLGVLFGVRVLTELLEPAAYGKLALGVTLATFVNQTILGPLGNGITRFYAPAQERGDLLGYFTSVRQLLSFATAMILLLIPLVVASLMIVGSAQWIAISTAAIFFALLSGYISIISGILSAARQRFIVALHQGLEVWVRFLVVALLVVWLGATSTLAMCGYVIGAALVLASQWLFFRNVVFKHASRSLDQAEEQLHNWQQQIWKFFWPISIFGVFTWARLASDRWALELFSTTDEVGVYAVLIQVGYYPISLLTGMAMQFLGPIFYQRAGDASDKSRSVHVNTLSWRVTGLAFGMTAVAVLATLLFHAEIFHVIVAKEYASVSYLLPWVVLAGGVFAAGEALALNLMSQMKTRRMMYAKITTALLAIIFNVIGAYWYGTIGVVISGVVFSASYFSWMALLSKYP